MSPFFFLLLPCPFAPWNWLYDPALLVLFALIGAVSVLPWHVIPPQVPPHPDVAHGHAGQGQHVGDGKEEEVVAIVQGGLAWQTIWPDFALRLPFFVFSC